MNAPAILERLQTLGVAIAGSALEAVDPSIAVLPEALRPACFALRDDAQLRFNFLHCISGVDFLQTDLKKKVDFQPHCEVLYHLSSLVFKHRITLRALLPRWKNDVAGELPELPTVSDIWRAADWHEREVYDLSGVRFVNHPDPRRILCPDDWQGHPLRKDYTMPLEYDGIRGR